MVNLAKTTVKPKPETESMVAIGFFAELGLVQTLIT
jgi:hypothetical protein